ncbi:MAG: methylated-DNA--[protein]-cysteine S-methyltransferase [Bacillota bacterium]|nr:methylated-DNA--[protein]-cysteine S-methyltransferase [Bacillota bacterium]
MKKAYYNSPIGTLEIISSDEGIEEINFIKESKEYGIENNIEDKNIKECIRQLEEYFQGNRKEFTVRLNLKGTDFQKQVWNELMRIPYGKTVTYKHIAQEINNPKAVRAVGGANNKNKIPIIIPCHRVIGTSGKLIGYAGGLDIKEFLLKHEGIDTRR